MITTPSQAQTSMVKMDFLQLLAAQEKLSYDVLMDLAEVHDRGPFVIMARAEERDLKRIRRLLRLHGWEDLTKGDDMGEFTHFPTMEQMYEDMLTDEQYSVGDGYVFADHHWEGSNPSLIGPSQWFPVGYFGILVGCAQSID